MVSKNQLLILLVALSAMVVAAAIFIGVKEDNLTPVQKANQYVSKGNILDNQYNKLIWNIATNFVKNTPFDQKVAINAQPQIDGLNLYVVGKEDTSKPLAPKDNCAYYKANLERKEPALIVCSAEALQIMREKMSLPSNAFDTLEWREKASNPEIVAQINRRFAFFLTEWLIGHEIGHAVRDWERLSGEAKSIPRENEETQVDQFVIQQLNQIGRNDLFWAWLGLSNIIPSLYDRAAKEQTGQKATLSSYFVGLGPIKNPVKLRQLRQPDPKDPHPGWLKRTLDMQLLLLKDNPDMDTTGFMNRLNSNISLVDGTGSTMRLKDVQLDAGYDLGLILLDPSSSLAKEEPGVFSFKQGNEAMWLTAYDRAVDYYNKAINEITTAFRLGKQPGLDMDLPLLYLRRGVAYFIQGTEKQTNPTLNGSSTPPKFFYEKAIADWQKALELDPDYMDAYNNLGFAYYELGQLEEAIKAWQVVLNQDKNYDDSWAGLAVALYDQGQLEKAKQAYQTALAIEPNYGSLIWVRYERDWTPDTEVKAGKLLELVKSERN